MTCRHHQDTGTRRRKRNSCRLAAVALVWSVAAGYTVFRLAEMALTDSSVTGADGGGGSGGGVVGGGSGPSPPQGAAASLTGADSTSGTAGLPIGGGGDQGSLEDAEFPAVTLCNINPAKGSELVKMNAAQYNVTNAYESLVDFIKYKSAVRSSHIPIKAIFESSGHTIGDMLKGCQFSNKRKCDEYSFEHSTTIMGRCYTLHPDTLKNSDTNSVKLLLDPQGYDYLLPNEGFVGITVIIHSPYEPIVANLDQSLQAGPKFHTTIHVTTSGKANPAPCMSRQDWKQCADKCFASAMLTKCKCAISDMPYCTLNDLAKCGVDISENPGINWLSKCSCGRPCTESDYRIQSVVQTPRSTLLSRLQTIKERDTLARKTEMVEAANLVQQWAFLRETNRTAFASLHTLSGLLAKISDMFVKAVQGLKKVPLTWHINFVRDRPYTQQCMDGVSKVSQVLGNMREGAQRVKDFSGSLFFETGIHYPNDDFLFRVVNLFYKYSPEAIRAEFGLYDLTNFYQDLTNFEIALDNFKRAKCSNGIPGGGGAGSELMKPLLEEDSTIKILLSEIQRLSKEFARIFDDIYSHNEAIRQAYPASKSKIKQLASPKSQSSFVALTVKLQKEQKIRVQPAAVRIVQTQSHDRVLFLITSTLSISLFLTLVVHLMSRLRCRPNSKPSTKVKAVRPPQRAFRYDEEDRISCPMEAPAASEQLNKPAPTGNPRESDCAVSNNDYDDGWM